MSSTEPVSGPRPARPPADWLRTPGLGGFHASVGFSVDPEATGNGACVVRGTVEERHLNINRVVHGGVYATILDTAMGGSVVTTLRDGEVTATTSLYIEFLRPAEEGAHLRARGEVVRRGRHLAFVEGNLYNGDGVRLSQAHGTWYIWSADDGTWTRRTTRMRRAAPAKP
jgi:acyl-coenzyme A thioesterase 13